MSLIHQYVYARKRFRECLAGADRPLYAGDNCDVMWLMGAGDWNAEMEMIEDMMLGSMEGLA